MGKAGKARVLVHRKSVPLFEKEIKFYDEQAQVEVSKTLLPIGISQITVLSEGNDVINQRVIFNAPADKYDVEVQLEKEPIRPGKSNVQHFEKRYSGFANLSVNIRKLEPNVRDPYSISDYLLLQNGNVQLKDLRATLAADNQVQTQKDSYYPINVKGQDEGPGAVYLPEVRGNIITGTVRKADGSPAIKEIVYLTVPAPDYLFFAAAVRLLRPFLF